MNFEEKIDLEDQYIDLIVIYHFHSESNHYNTLCKEPKKGKFYDVLSKIEKNENIQNSLLNGTFVRLYKPLYFIFMTQCSDDCHRFIAN